MNKREFIRKGISGTLGISIVPSIVRANIDGKRTINSPQLFTDFSGLNRLGSNHELKQHYFDSYHNASKKVLQELENNKIKASLPDIFSNASKHQNSTLALTADFYNHRLFWKTLYPASSKQLSAKLKSDIEKSFTTLDNFEEKFCLMANECNNKGWLWLIFNNGNLRIVATEKNTNPFFNTIGKDQKGIPLLGLDLDPHSYHKTFDSKYNYCKAYFKLINWSFVSKRYNKILSGKL